MCGGNGIIFGPIWDFIRSSKGSCTICGKQFCIGIMSICGLSICEPIGKSIGSPGGAGEVLGTAGDLLIGCPIGCPIG